MIYQYSKSYINPENPENMNPEHMNPDYIDAREDHEGIRLGIAEGSSIFQYEGFKILPYSDFIKSLDSGDLTKLYEIIFSDIRFKEACTAYYENYLRFLLPHPP